MRRKRIFGKRRTKKRKACGCFKTWKEEWKRRKNYTKTNIKNVFSLYLFRPLCFCFSVCVHESQKWILTRNLVDVSWWWYSMVWSGNSCKFYHVIWLFKLCIPMAPFLFPFKSTKKHDEEVWLFFSLRRCCLLISYTLCWTSVSNPVGLWVLVPVV